MTPRLRLVFDTNVIVSADLFEDSVPGQALSLALDLGTLLLSEALIEELRAVLSRPRFDRYATRAEREEFLRDLIHEAATIAITQQIQACRDANDDKILELAVNGEAEYIVTGDDDLLVMNPFRGINIVTPAEFLMVATVGDQPDGYNP